PGYKIGQVGSLQEILHKAFEFEKSSPYMFSKKSNKSCGLYQVHHQSKNLSIADGMIKNDRMGTIKILMTLEMAIQRHREVIEDNNEVVKYIMLAANYGNAEALYTVGKGYYTGTQYLKKDLDTAKEYLNEAKKRSELVGLDNLGKGKSVESDKNAKQAFDYSKFNFDAFVDGFGAYELGNRTASGQSWQSQSQAPNMYVPIFVQPQPYLHPDWFGYPGHGPFLCPPSFKGQWNEFSPQDSSGTYFLGHQPQQHLPQRPFQQNP
ncbi:27418_t:CDS:2, partial [Dentiscutata erythropus]